MTSFLTDVDVIQAGYDARWPATQVGLRGFKSCLGGHDDGVSVDDEGVEKASIQLLERGRKAMSNSQTFSGFA